MAWTGELTLAPAGPATPWSPGIPYRDTNGGLVMYRLFRHFCGFNIQTRLNSVCVCVLLTLSPGLPASPADPAGPGRP